MGYKKIKLSDVTIRLADGFPAESISKHFSTESFTDGQRSSFEKLNSSRFANVYRFKALFHGRVHSLILKQYLNRSFADSIKHLFRPSRAKRAFGAGRMLQRYNFSTPQLIALGNKNIAGIKIRNFLITKELENAASLAEILKTADPQKQQLITQFGQTVGRLHAKNIFHGDLRLGNVLVKKDGDNFEFFFLDNERTKKFRKLPLSLRIKNLTQVNMFRHNIDDDDRKCFWNAYIALQKNSIDYKKLVKQVIAKTEKRLAAKQPTDTAV